MIGTVISCAAASLAFGLWIGHRIHRREWTKVADAIDAMERMEADVERLRKSRHEARYERDRAREAARVAGEVNEEQRKRVAGLEELLGSIATRAESLHAYHGEAVAAIRGIVDRAVGDEPAHSGQFVAHSGPFGWIPVEERMPTDEDVCSEVDVLVVAETANDRWTDRAWLANEDRSWRWSVNDEPLTDRIRITHWMPVPEPPGCEGAPPVVSGREGSKADVPTATLSTFGSSETVEVPLESEGNPCP